CVKRGARRRCIILTSARFTRLASMRAVTSSQWNCSKAGRQGFSQSRGNRYFEFAMFSHTQYDLPRMRDNLERAVKLDPHFAEARNWYGFTGHWVVDGLTAVI